MPSPPLVVVRVLAVASALVLAVVVARAGLLLGNDSPQHLYSGMVAAHIDDPDAGYAPYWRANDSLSARGFVELFGALEGVFGWQTAYRLALGSIALVWAAGAFLVVWAVERRRAWLGLLAFPASLQWSFYLGFLPFFLATGLGLLVLAAVIARARQGTAGGLVGWKEVAFLAAAGFVVARVHVIAALFLWAAIGLVVLLTRARDLPRAALAAVPVVAVAFLTRAQADLGAEPPTWLPWSQRVAQLVTHFLPGPWWRAGIGAVACAGAALGVSWRDRPVEPSGDGAVDRSADRCIDRAVGLAGLAFVVATLALPWAGSWQLVSPRPLAWAFPCLLAATPIERLHGLLAAGLDALLGARLDARLGRARGGGWRPRARHLGAVAVVAWCALAFTWADAFHARLAAARDESLAFLSAGPGAARARLRMPVVLVDGPAVPEVPALDPAIHLGQLAGAAWGGFVFFSHTGSPAIHPVAPRPELEAEAPQAPDPRLVFAARRENDPARRARLVDEIAAQSAAIDEVIVLGRPADLAAFDRRGYVARARGADWVVASVPKCAVEISVAGLPRAALVGVGVGGAPLPSHTWEVAPGSHQMTMELPCGPLWLAVPGLPCEGAGPRGHVELEARPGEAARARCVIAR